MSHRLIATCQQNQGSKHPHGERRRTLPLSPPTPPGALDGVVRQPRPLDRETTMSRPLGRLLIEWLPVQRPGTMKTRAGGPPFLVPRAVEIRKGCRCRHEQASEDGNEEVLLRPVSSSAPTSRTEQTKIRDPPYGLGKASAPFSLKAHRVLSTGLNRRRHLCLCRRLWLVANWVRRRRLDKFKTLHTLSGRVSRTLPCIQAWEPGDLLFSSSLFHRLELDGRTRDELYDACPTLKLSASMER